MLPFCVASTNFFLFREALTASNSTLLNAKLKFDKKFGVFTANAILNNPEYKKVKGNIGLIIKGYFNAPQDDIYTFALLSDDGSTLTIDSEQIVDNDGPHGPKEIVGQKALAKGYHPMELRYFDQNGGQLKLKVTGSDGKEIPFTHLYAH